MEQYSSISALRLKCFDFERSPAKTLAPYTPDNAKQSAWIPQTLGDQVWVLFEFATQEDRETWERSLPPELAECLDRELIEHALPYGWNVRDANGFIIERET